MRYAIATILLLSISTMAKYDPDLALNMLHVSGLAYWDAIKIHRSKCNNATTLTESIGLKVLRAKDNGKDLDAISYVILEWAKKKKFVVAFSGTHGIKQLIREFNDGIPVSYSIHPKIKDALVIKYFYMHYKDEFKAEFIQVMKYFYNKKKYSKYDIIFTGHSLGGALAVHAAADFVLTGVGSQNFTDDIIKSSFKPYIQVYTFGQPRIGNSAFNDPVKAKIDEWYRVVHNKDVVVHIPPWIPNFERGCIHNGSFPFYPYHAAEEIYYDKPFENYKECNQTEGEDPTCSNENVSDSISDHKVYFGIRVSHLHRLESQEITLIE